MLMKHYTNYFTNLWFD